MPSVLQVRQLTLPDLDECARIEGQHAWTLEVLHAFLAEPWRGGYVALWEGRIVAFLLYHADRARRRLHIVRVGVTAAWQRRRAGSRLLQHIRQWLRPVPDVEVVALVGERRLDVQCFLRANGFRAVRICRGCFDDGHDDGYVFQMTSRERLAVARG